MLFRFQVANGFFKSRYLANLNPSPRIRCRYFSYVLISSHVLSPFPGRGGAVLGHLRRLYLHRLLLPLEHPGAEINTSNISVNIIIIIIILLLLLLLYIYIHIYIYTYIYIYIYTYIIDVYVYNLIVTAVTIRSISSLKIFEDIFWECLRWVF